MMRSPLHPFKPFRIVLLLVASALSVSCSVNDSTDQGEDNDCILQQIQFNEFSSLNFKTLSGGRIYNLTQEFTQDGETEIVESFLYKYAPDSIAILDQNDPFSIYPFISVNLEDGKPVRVVKFFSNLGVRLIHDIDYSQPNQIRIDITRIVSYGDQFYEGYAIYHLDSDGNVTRNERFDAIQNNPEELRKIEDRTFIYDSYPNPQKHLYLPFFATRTFPDVKFFSANNIISFTEQGQTFQFQNEYGGDENMVAQTLPDGQTIFFNYINCGEEQN